MSSTQPHKPKRRNAGRKAALAKATATRDAEKPRKNIAILPSHADVAIAELARGYSVVRACAVAGIERRNFYYRLNTDQEFAARVAEAQHAGILYLDDIARSRGAEGTAEPVIYQGELQYCKDPVTGALKLDGNGDPIPLTVNKLSDNLLMFTLKSRDRAKYADRHELTGADGGPLQTEDVTTARRGLRERLAGIGKRLTMERTTVTERLTVEE